MTRRSSGELRDDLQRWVTAGLLGREQAEAIAVNEAAAAAPPAGVSVLAEALGYAGAALALAGIVAAIGNSWDTLGSGGRMAAAAIPTVLAVGAGWTLHSKTEAAFRRLMSLLWFLAIGGFAGTAGVVLDQFTDIDEDWIALVIGLAMAVPAFILWRLHGAVLQQMALLGSLVVTVLGVFMILPGEPSGPAMALAAWALGMVWVLAGWRRVITPQTATMVLGALLTSYAPVVGAEDHEWLLFVGIATGGALMALGVKTGLVALLAIGTVAVFGYVTAVVLRYFGDQLGVPLALTIIGGVFIGLALLASRLGRFGRKRPDET
ncbi:MAG TPA: DUF2157 domain-containing protein [Acidimicrobiia bacterium]|nr:DUF2157 domain-containing protein [Acidimicrobiia bacterium]